MDLGYLNCSDFLSLLRESKDMMIMVLAEHFCKPGSGSTTQDRGLSGSFQDFPDGAVVKNMPANAGDTGSSPGPGRSHMLWSN